MKALLATVVVASFVVVGVNLLMGGRKGAPATATTVGTTTVVLRSVPAPQLTAHEINRQDPPDARRQREEARVFDRRPLLSALPMTLQSVHFEIGGLAADGRTTIIRANAGGLGHRRARVAFNTLRRRTADRSRSYRLDITP
jgi:hypothetical protein